MSAKELESPGEAPSAKVQSELEKRTAYVKALQRNYECIGNAYRKIVAELHSAKKKLAEANQSAVIVVNNHQEKAELQNTIEKLCFEKAQLTVKLERIESQHNMTLFDLSFVNDRMKQTDAQNQKLEAQIAKANQSAQESRSEL
jgi:hypothetical protein